MKLLLCAALALAGCGKAKNQASDDDQMHADIVAGSVTKDVAKIKAALAGPKPDDAKYECAASLAGLPDLQKVASYAALAKELDDLCNHDIHVAMIKVETEKAEAARKAKPDANPLSECFDAYYSLASEALAKAKREDATSKALQARFAAVCPNEKK